nr:hypothetical protein DOP62_03350 [Synechococcus elongatus PCC 11801]
MAIAPRSVCCQCSDSNPGLRAIAGIAPQVALVSQFFNSFFSDLQNQSVSVREVSAHPAQ